MPNVSVSEAVDSLLSRLLQLIADKDVGSDVVRAFITVITHITFCAVSQNNETR